MNTVCKLQRTKTGGAEGKGETYVYRRKERDKGRAHKNRAIN